MSETGKAVFLSYASQDAEAARRIAEALRAAGVEVWFDQSELVGGDAWDAKIRKQIAECALFVPVISANTQARREGYFRIEWKLAAQRTYAIADDEAFLLPVVIDDTKDAVAKVPPEFKTVQWTKLLGGETPAAFCGRVNRLLEREVGAPFDDARSAVIPDASRRATPTRGLRIKWWWLLPIFGLSLVLLLVLKESRTDQAPAAVPAHAPESAAWKLAQRALDLLASKEGISRERLEAADQFCKQALDLDPLDGRIFAVAAQVDTAWVYYQMDNSEARKQQAKNHAARAAVLAPGQPRVRYAQAGVYAAVIGTPAMLAEAEKLLRGLKDDPDVGHEAQVILGTLLRDTGRAAEAAVFFEQIGDLGSAGWAYAKAGKDDEVLRVADIQLRRGHNVGALIQKYNVMVRREDLPAMADVVRQFTPEDLLNDGPAISAMYLALCQRDAARILEVAAAFPREYCATTGFFEPKRCLTGWAHRLAGRPELARTEWRSALTTVEELLKVRPNDLDLLSWQAGLQGWLGDQADAEKTLHLYLSLTNEPTGVNAFITRLEVNLGLGRTEESIQQLLTAGFNDQQMQRIHSDLRFSPEFDPLRSDPRFEKYLRDTLPKEAKPFEDQRPTVGDSAFAKATADASGTAAPPDAKSVAVLAFANLSDDKENEYFSDGISEELLNVLAKVPGLKVAARTSAFYFKGKEVPVPEIARQLGVAYVVEGSVRKSGDKVRITAQLIKAADGFHVWSDTFTRELKDIFAVQTDVAARVAAELKVKVMGATKVPTTNMEAYLQYQTGRFWWNKRTMAGMEKAIASYQAAIALDPDYADAYAGLAAAHTLAQNYVGTPSAVVQPKARAAALKALALDPGSAEAHAVLGSVAESGYDWSTAVGEYRQAIALNPNYATAHHWLSNDLTMQGRLAEARAEIRRAGELDPLSLIIKATEGTAELALGHHDQALQLLRQGLELDPNFLVLRESLGSAYLLKGMLPEAVGEFRKMRSLDPDGPYGLGELGYALALAGDREGARAVLGEIDGWRSHSLTVDYQSAKVWLGLGDFDQVFKYLGGARVANEPMLDLLAYPRWRALHGDRRWPIFLSTVGLADEQLK